MGILDSARDDDLLKRAARGDEEAFTLLYRRHQASIYRYALRMTAKPWEAEEIVQEVFMMLVREPQKYDPARGALGAFLFGVARNRVLKHLERTPRELSLDQEGERAKAIPHSGHTPASWAELEERREQVRSAVLELPAEFREAVVLCELEELSYEEAAELSGCPIGTIRSRLHRGRALLLVKLEMLRSAPRKVRAAG